MGTSCITPVECAVPQGSVLGPVLFLLYASGVIKLVQNCGLSLYLLMPTLTTFRSMVTLTQPSQRRWHGWLTASPVLERGWRVSVSQSGQDGSHLAWVYSSCERSSTAIWTTATVFSLDCRLFRLLVCNPSCMLLHDLAPTYVSQCCVPVDAVTGRSRLRSADDRMPYSTNTTSLLGHGHFHRPARHPGIYFLLCCEIRFRASHCCTSDSC